MKSNPHGAAGEEYAAKILTEYGYSVVARNFSCRFGEIDLIVENGDVIAFVEVKTRKYKSMISGAEAVTYSKQKKIIATALHYLQEHYSDLQPRFDIFCVTTGSSGTILKHEYLEGAFDGDVI